MNSGVYQKAEAFLPWNLHRHIYNAAIFPYWGEGVLYYFQGASSGFHLVEVEQKTGRKMVLFGLCRIAALLSDELNNQIEEHVIPLQNFSFDIKSHQFILNYGGLFWCFTLDGVFVKKEIISNSELFSPDRSWILKIDNYNLALIDMKQNTTQKLTHDGRLYHDYASSPETNTHAITDKLALTERAPIALWSQDSTKFITHRLDQRFVEKLYLLQSAPDGKQRPTLHEYRMSFSGDEHLPRVELIIFDAVNKTATPLKRDALLSPYLTPIEYHWVWWSKSGDKVYYLEEARASKKLLLCVCDAKTGTVGVLIEEESDTYVEPCEFFLWRTNILILEVMNVIVWMSMRDGYPHLYYYKMGKCEPEYAITSGAWSVRELLFYEPIEDWLYFTAAGKNSSIDPYFKQLYRCHLDGSGLMCLTEEVANHTIIVSPARDCFIDTFSTIDTAPTITLKKMDGSVIGLLESADIQHLKKMHWVPPLRFREKGRDKKTDIYGNIYFPSDFDKNKKYPLIDHIYPGPQVCRTAVDFALYTEIYRSPWVSQALAELGFIVVQMDGFGTPGRSVEFHHATYGNMADGGLPDHVAVIDSLIKKHAYIEADRIGITGYSGGGYAAARGMMTYPDLYKVGVAAAGNHDLRCYPANYGEKYNGLKGSCDQGESNASIAKQLAGKLLLIHGEMDDNVHMCATMQLVDALIKNNKNFDMLIMPNLNHRSTFDHPYYWRKHWDYLVKNLLQVDPPEEYSFGVIMPNYFPQLCDF